jgi:hypothetical protein
MSGFEDRRLVDDLGVVVKFQVEASLHRRGNSQHMVRETGGNLDGVIEGRIV